MAELCRREGIHPTVYYTWLKDFMEAGKARMRGDSLREATTVEVQELRQENERLKAAHRARPVRPRLRWSARVHSLEARLHDPRALGRGYPLASIH